MKPFSILFFVMLMGIAPGSRAGLGTPDLPSDTVHLKKLMKQMGDYNIFEIPGSLPHSTVQTERSEKMAKELSPYDLMKICMENSNPIVRLYAFMNLANRMDNIPIEIVQKFNNDSTLINFKNPRGEIKKVPLSQIANGFLK